MTRALNYVTQILLRYSSILFILVTGTITIKTKIWCQNKPDSCFPLADPISREQVGRADREVIFSRLHFFFLHIVDKNGGWGRGCVTRRWRQLNDCNAELTLSPQRFGNVGREWKQKAAGSQAPHHHRLIRHLGRGASAQKTTAENAAARTHARIGFSTVRASYNLWRSWQKGGLPGWVTGNFPVS